MVGQGDSPLPGHLGQNVAGEREEPKMALSVWSDPGHAWLRVPKDEYPDGYKAGTGYGYEDADAWYLEEDVEVGLFLDLHPELREQVRRIHSIERSPRNKNYIGNHAGVTS